MDRLDMAIALLEEARNEKKRVESYNRDYAKRPNDMSYWEYMRKLEEKYGRVPSKAVVNDNLKMARRLILAEYM